MLLDGLRRPLHKKSAVLIGAALVWCGTTAALGGAPAHADTTTATATAKCSSWKNIYSAKSGGYVVHLQYSKSCRIVRAHLNKKYNKPWMIWVYNKDTNASATVYSPDINSGWISNKGTKAHACVQKQGYAKACTKYF